MLTSAAVLARIGGARHVLGTLRPTPILRGRAIAHRLAPAVHRARTPVQAGPGAAVWFARVNRRWRRARHFSCPALPVGRLDNQLLQQQVQEENHPHAPARTAAVARAPAGLHRLQPGRPGTSDARADSLAGIKFPPLAPLRVSWQSLALARAEPSRHVSHEAPGDPVPPPLRSQPGRGRVGELGPQALGAHATDWPHSDGSTT